jgi:hypothetical protein
MPTVRGPEDIWCTPVSAMLAYFREEIVLTI